MFDSVRPSFYSDSFYPEDPNAIVDIIKKLESHIKIPVIKGELFGAIVPHAGYIYSGYCALHVYKILQSIKKIKQIIIIGPYHKDMTGDIVIPDYGSWKTPFGDVLVNEEILKHVIQQFDENDMPCRLEKNDKEHSLEVQMPLIKYFLPDAKIIPMMCNNMGLYKKICDIVDSIISERDDTIFLVSSDLSHYNPEIIAKDIDAETIEHILDFDEKAVVKDVEDKQGMCGYVGILSLCNLAKKLGLDADLLNYSNSTRGIEFLGLKKEVQNDSVVGYSSIIFYK